MVRIMKLFRRSIDIPHCELVAKVQRLERADLIGLLRDSQCDSDNDPSKAYQEVLKYAESCYREGPDWVTFFREVLGIEGVVRRAFPTFDELTSFEKSDEFEKIQKLLVKLREQRPSADADNEPTRVITVRLPKCMHESLRTEAHDLRTSMNKLCISKLLQVIGEEMIPNESAGTRPSNSTPNNSYSSTSGSTMGSRPQVSPQTLSSPFSQQLQSPPFKPTQPRF